MAPQPTTRLVTIVCLLLLQSATCIHAEMGLWFIRSPEPIVAPPGDEVVFECSLNVPADQVRWKHDGRFLHHNHGNETNVVGSENHSMKSSRLVVKVRDAQQAGDYQCVARIGASALASVPAKLSLAELQAFPHQPNRNFKVAVGNTVALHCDTPYSNPPALFQYYKNGEKLPGTMEFLASTGTLILHNVTLRDAGKYHCTATNYITGQTVITPFNITLDVVPQGVGSAPMFLDPQRKEYIIQAGCNVTLECSAVGDPPPQVTWYKSGGTLPVNRTELLPGGLHLSHVDREDEGTYICEMDNNVGQPVKHSAVLHIHEPPEMVKELKPRSPMVEEGSDLQLDCVVKGSPQPTVTWLLNGEPVTNDSHVKTSGEMLNITEVEKRHAGIFQCFAMNELGSVYGWAMMQVLPKQVTAQSVSEPGNEETDLEDLPENGINFATPVPTSGFRGHGKKDHTRKGKGRRKDRKHKGNVMIPPSRPNITRLSDRSVMVRWRVPHNDGLPIQFFKVQYREMTRGGNGRHRGNANGSRSRGPSQGKGSSRWMTNNDDISPHIRSYAVDGLETDHTYRFRIAAVYSNNDNKLGPNSARFHLHRGPSNNKNPLSSPVLRHAEAVSSSAITISWQYTGSPSVPVEGFYVYYRQTSSAGDYIKATVEGEGQRSFVITHLQPDTSYDIKLQSFTVVGASNFSTIFTCKTLRLQTETPAVAPEMESTSGSGGEPSNTQLYVVLGAVLGSLLLLVVLFLIICIFNRQRNNSSQCSQDVNDHQDKFSDPAHQLESVSVFGLNSKNLINGCVSQNGFLQNNKMNITNNPLAETDEDKNQNVMEMSYLSSQNNNCSSNSEASGSGASGSSTSTSEPTQSNLCKVNTSDVKNWRVAVPDKTAEENYV